jgi:hypothetical protein
MDLPVSIAVINAVQSTSKDPIVKLPTAGGSLPLSIITRAFADGDHYGADCELRQQPARRKRESATAKSLGRDRDAGCGNVDEVELAAGLTRMDTDKSFINGALMNSSKSMDNSFSYLCKSAFICRLLYFSVLPRAPGVRAKRRQSRTAQD